VNSRQQPTPRSPPAARNAHTNTKPKRLCNGATQENPARKEKENPFEEIWVNSPS
jgi:hypothetical protein